MIDRTDRLQETRSAAGRILFFYVSAFLCLMAGIAALSAGDFVSAGVLLALFLAVPFLGRFA